MRKTNKYRKSSLFFLFVWFDWVLFVNGLIVIGWDEEIRKYCTHPNRCVGRRVTNKICFLLWNMKDICCKRTLEIKPKMGTYWPPRSWNGNRRNIFVFPIRKVTSWVGFIFIWRGSRFSNCHCNLTVVHKCDLWRISTFACGMNKFTYDQLTPLKSDV